MTKKNWIAIFVVYLITSGASFGVFAQLNKSGVSLLNPTGVQETAVPTPDPTNRLVIAPEAPKTEECPLNGKMYTTVERESWDTRRPLAIMIENHLESRPQSGLSKADIVYETVVEGGISRFMPIYYCEAQAKDTLVAPVRSARQFFIDMAAEYVMPLYAHVGGANGEDSDPRVRALEHLSDYGWTLRNDLNQFSIGYPTFVRNYSRLPGKDDLATEHTMESSTERLWAVGDKRGYTNMSPDVTVRGRTVAGTDWRDDFTPWAFKDDAAEGERGSVESISHEFWSGYPDFDVRWDYDRATNSYKRSMGGSPHVDLNDNKQIVAKNVLILQMREFPSVDIHHHNYIQTIGSGTGWLFRDGEAIEITWTKRDREARTTITAAGRPVEFTRGMVWVSVINTQTEPSY